MNCCGEEILTETYGVAAALMSLGPGYTPMVRVVISGKALSEIDARGHQARQHDHIVFLQPIQARDLAAMLNSMADAAEGEGLPD